MPTYLTPGVYIEEVPSGARPIEAVGTSTAGFVGVAPRAGAHLEDGKPEVVMIMSWSQFVQEFAEETYKMPTVQQRIVDGKLTPEAPKQDRIYTYKTTHLAAAVYGFFENGGTLCYVANVGIKPAENDTSENDEAKKDNAGAQSENESSDKRLDDVWEREKERWRQVKSGVEEADEKPSADENGEKEDDTTQDTDNPFADSNKPELEDQQGLDEKRGDILPGLESLADYDQIAVVAAPGFTSPMEYNAILSHCEKLKDRVAVLDTPNITDANDLLNDSSQRPRQSDDGFGALYFPWLEVRDPLSGGRITVPPSGHMAGIWARTDATRGVHKAPANETVRGALRLTVRVNRALQGLLNSNSVNCIRQFPREGIRVWGARTLAGSSSQWRYLNVRRLFNMIEESIAEATRWIVFEPNDETLWRSIRRDISAFLTLQWRDGALMGATPEQAFFVKCDAETNTSDRIDQGQVMTLIGIAPVKPAEFVIFRISQMQGGTETQEES
jgi:phage tail sheath protein FI